MEMVCEGGDGILCFFFCFANLPREKKKSKNVNVAIFYLFKIFSGFSKFFIDSA